MRNKSLLKRFLSLTLSFIFVVLIFGFRSSDTAVFAETQVPQIKMYAKCEPIEINTNKKNLYSDGIGYEKLTALYDLNTATVFEKDHATAVILDLEKAHMLGGVRVTAAKCSKAADKSRCNGTTFYVSNDKKVFHKAAELSGVNAADDNAETKELMFGGAGEYRYVKVLIPPKARISQIELLEYPEWKFKKSSGGKYDMQLKLYAYDVQKSMNARVVAAVYNSAGILKNFSSMEHGFEKGIQQDVEIQLSGLKRDLGDTYRIMIWDENGGRVLKDTLVYRDNGASAVFSIADVFADNMVIQADKPLKIWGKAPTKSEIEINLENIRGGVVNQTVKVNEGSDWEAELGSFSAGGNYRLTVSCGREVKVYSNITFGDVWLLAGQSNMEYYMYCGKDTTNYLKSKIGKAESDNQNIRFLNLLNRDIEGAGAPMENIPTADSGNWTVMTNDSAGYCSAIGYYFAKKINRNYDIPVGLICAAVGDTEIARWLPHGSYGNFESNDGGLFYNRISPISKMQIRGILMYQGEADEYRTHLTTVEYRDAMSGLVDLYRETWGEELPFYWAQLTRYNKDESNVRDGQRLARYHVKNQSNTGVISLIDVYGEYNSKIGSCRDDIHPHQKEVAAERFFLFAARDVYGAKDIAVSGPEYKEMRIIDNKIELTFDCTGSLAIMPQEKYLDLSAKKTIKKNKIDVSVPCEFEVAGQDGMYKRADAKIQGNKIILQSKEVKNPISARYAWGGYPEAPNLTDATGLPALSFCTENN